MKLNDALGEVVKVNKQYEQESNLEERILALHESATKIWQAQDIDLKKKRIINALISVLLLADELEISDIADSLEKRLLELQK